MKLEKSKTCRPILHRQPVVHVLGFSWQQTKGFKMNPWINYHHLYYFMVIAELGSVSKAAEKLRLGQPTLSAQLKQFEDHLGVKLFERQHKKIFLSEQGKLALDYARSIFQLGGEMYDALHDRLKPTKTSVQIGALDSIPKQILFKIFTSAYKDFPCAVVLREARFDELIRELINYRLDLVVANYLPPAEVLKGLFHRLVIKSPIHIYGAPEFKHLKKNFPQSLAAQPFAVPTYDSQTRYTFDHWLKLKELKIDIIAETQDIALTKLMATEGAALLALPEYSVRKQVKAGELVDLGAMENAFEELYFISANRKISNPVAASLMKSFVLS
jgi:LysR family transcriptional regulator, transcriptional activator of nhaA